MFDQMISEKLIEWLWILGSIGVVIFGLLMMFAGAGFAGFIMGVMYIAIGLLVVRILCESMLVAFKMFSTSRRSLLVMEQISKDQAATRQAIQSFLAQAAAGGGVQPRPTVAQSTSATTVRQESASGSSYNDQMSAARANLQQQVESQQSEGKSRLGDWPTRN